MTALIIAIYILTVADAVSTAVGVSSGVISEGNALFQSVMQSNPVLTAIVVSLIMGAVLYGIWRIRKRIKWLPFAMVGVLLVKIYIMGIHGYWIYQATALSLW
jgi:hypothetical protein